MESKFEPPFSKKFLANALSNNLDIKSCSAKSGNGRNCLNLQIFQYLYLQGAKNYTEERELEFDKYDFFINNEFCDPIYDYDFSYTFDGDMEYYRGGIRYFRPCGWKRYAIKVSGKYPNDRFDKWLGKSGESKKDKEWANCYHTSLMGQVEDFCKMGELLKEDKDKNDKITGIYCTPDIDIAADYSKPFQYNKKYWKLVFQNRVRPSAIIECKNYNEKAENYWFVRNEENIRPFGICIVEVDSQGNPKYRNK